MSDPLVRDYVRSAAASAELITSVCTGSLILGAVGLLKGRDATTNWFYSGILESLGDVPPAQMSRGRQLDHVRRVSAGIDMALHLAARLTDEATARQVQRAIAYDPRPPWGGIHYDRIPRFPRALRGGIGLLAPVITAKPKRLARPAPDPAAWWFPGRTHIGRVGCSSSAVGAAAVDRGRSRCPRPQRRVWLLAAARRPPASWLRLPGTWAGTPTRPARRSGHRWVPPTDPAGNCGLPPRIGPSTVQAGTDS